jgi:hypothetical protein
LCAAVAAAAVATGDISRAYLTHAAQGRFAEPLTTLVRHIGEGAEHGTVEPATLAALRVGHSSGSDGIFGLLLGLAVWAPQSILSELARPSDALPGLTRQSITCSDAIIVQPRPWMSEPTPYRGDRCRM